MLINTGKLKCKFLSLPTYIVSVFELGTLDAQKISMNWKTFSAKPKQIFGYVTRNILYVVKDIIATHYRAKMFSHLFGVDLQNITTILGEPNNYLIFAEIKVRYGISEMDRDEQKKRDEVGGGGEGGRIWI
jgi:hypothetical protein